MIKPKIKIRKPMAKVSKSLCDEIKSVLEPIEKRHNVTIIWSIFADGKAVIPVGLYYPKDSFVPIHDKMIGTPSPVKNSKRKQAGK